MAWRVMRTALLLGCAALALGACGGDDSSSADRPSARDRALDGAVAFARCMREHGVDMPDPTAGSNGMIRIGPGPGKAGARPNPDDPAFARGEAACRRHLDGAMPDPKVPEEHPDSFVAYARCMRERGIDMPDPGPSGAVQLKGDPNAVNPDAPAFRRAHAGCRRHLAEVDEALGEATP